MRAMRWLMVPILVGAMGGVAMADFKNLQVLPKSMSKDELKAYMKAQSKALGVECDHCHDMPNAEKETKNKTTARAMMRMQNDINDKYLKTADSKVTCDTCHRGKEKPESVMTKK